MDLLSSLEETAFSIWIRETPALYAYPTVLALHTVGLVWLVGPNFIINLRILGFPSSLSLKPLARLFPVMLIGFWLNAITGLALVIAYATQMLVNPALYIKLGFIALAVVNLRLIMKKVLRNPQVDDNAVPMNAKILAVTSLVFWIGAISAGRLMAYIHLIFG